MKKFKILILLILISASSAFSQEKSVGAFDSKYLNWYNLDWKNDHVMGASVDKAYKEVLSHLTIKKIITVAVIDGGVDVNHDDLKGKIWSNQLEIEGNGIDDDKNGFIDDVHGWNFIGNTKGENVISENFEYTRLYKLGASHADYVKAKKMYDDEMIKRTKAKENISRLEYKYITSKQLIKDSTGRNVTK
ncbi:MAG: hypothetical protein WCH34_15375, partial [Bacteroidota bacterium]